MNKEEDGILGAILILIGALIFSLAIFIIGAVLYGSNYGEGNEYISLTIEGCGFFVMIFGFFGFFNSLNGMLEYLGFGEYIESTRFGKFITSVFDSWEEE